MKLVLLILLTSGLIASGCQFPQRPVANWYNPCEDTRLRELQKKHIYDMSQEEFEYYKRMTDSCDNFNLAVKQNRHPVSNEGMSTATTLLIVFFGVPLALGLLAIIIGAAVK